MCKSNNAIKKLIKDMTLIQRVYFQADSVVAISHLPGEYN
jgi:hypothetical protein